MEGGLFAAAHPFETILKPRDTCSLAFAVFQGDFQTFLERLHAEKKENLPGLFFGSQPLPDLDEPFVEIDADARENFLLRDVDRLRMPLSSIPACQLGHRPCN